VTIRPAVMNGGNREQRKEMNSSVIDKRTEEVRRNTTISICRVS
jgi:hypothetical protein